MSFGDQFMVAMNKIVELPFARSKIEKIDPKSIAAYVKVELLESYILERSMCGNDRDLFAERFLSVLKAKGIAFFDAQGITFEKSLELLEDGVLNIMHKV